MSSPKTGVLLVNLGTPASPETADVRRYLREFLSDPRVIDINPVGRWFLVNLIIAPFRSPKSAEAYRSIWTQEGSPLLVHGRALREAVEARIGDDTPVELAMRYGNPSLAQGLDALRERGCDHLIVLPLYPQYADSTTGSTIAAIQDIARGRFAPDAITFVPAFYDDAGFLDAFVAVTRAGLEHSQPEHVLFSFHGLPAHQVRKADPTGAHCLASDSCCASITDANRNCYRAQCYATARGLAQRLGLDDEGYTVAFQSRLGRTEWIRPYTDDIIEKLAERGIKRLAVFCPAFVADCLETLEEIGMRASESFVAAGGDTLTLLPCLNAEAPWADAVIDLVRRNQP